MSQSIIKHRVRGMPAQDGAGVKLKRVINQPAFRHRDPILMLDEFKSDNPNDYIAGFSTAPTPWFLHANLHVGWQYGARRLERK